MVREESACACDWACDGLSVRAGDREEEIRGVSARSARWIAIRLPNAGEFAMVIENPRPWLRRASIAEIEAVEGFDDVSLQQRACGSSPDIADVA